MFYYVIYNSTVLNYSNNNKKLNTFIYGTVLYILSHGLINSYDNQFAKYIKSYFWVILAIDIFSIYYLHNFIDNNDENETETDKNSLKSLLETFYNKQDKNEKKEKKDQPHIQEKITNDEENVNLEINKKENTSEHGEVNNEEPQPYFPEDLDINEKIKNHTDDNTFDENNNNNNTENFDQMSEAGSDFDLDKFEESLQ
jgi:uncharacterized membrane protein